MHRQRTEGELFSLLTVRTAAPGAPEADGTDRPAASPTAA
jgi:hypothetical protein